MAFGERGCVCRFFRSYVDRSSATAHVCNETRGWLHNARCSDSHEYRAFIECVEDAIQFERQFAEPADVRSNPTPAVAPGKLGWRIVSIYVAEGCATAPVAAALEEFPVHVDDALRSSLLVKVIHILRAEEQAVTQGAFELRESEVRRVGLRRRRDTPPHRVELPDQPRIVTPRMR